MRRALTPVAPIICWALALSQVFLGLGCQDRINGSGRGAQTTLAGVLGSTDIGAVAWELWRQQIAAEPASPAREARLNELIRQRDPFVQAINDIVNVRTLQGVAQTAEALFALVDDGTIPTLTAHVASALELLAQDPQALDAVLQLGRAQKSGIPPEELLLLLGRMFNYPETGELWSATAAIIRENDGVDDAGQPNGEPTLVPDLLCWGHEALLKASGQQGPAGPLQRAFPDLCQVLAGEAAVRGTFDYGPPEWVARADARGLPKVATNPASGLPEAPFVDLDRDGLADADAEGRFLDAGGAVLDLPIYGRPGTTGFDASGRAVDAAGVLRYEYVDAKRTVLAIHMKAGGELLAKDALGHAHRLLMAALGPRQADGSYGPDHPLAELTWGALDQLESETTLATWRACAALLRSDPARAERILVSISRAHAASLQAAQQGGTTLASGRLSDPRVQQLVADLLPLMDALSEQPGRGPSTLRTVLSTLAQLKARAPDFGAKLAPLFVHSRVVREAVADGDRNDVDEARSIRVDHASAAGLVNRSAIQQLLDLLARSDRCQFLGRSLAVWIVDMMADLSPQTVGSLASLVTGLPGFLQNLLCPGTSNDIASLDALAQSGALDGFLPLAKAFKDRGETELLVRLLVRSQQSYDPLLRQIEPDVALYLGSGVLDEVEDLLVQAETVRDPRSGRAVIDLLADGVAELVDDDAVVLDRQGQRVPARAHLFLRPLTELDRRAAAAGVGADLDALMRAMLEVFLSRAPGPNGQEVLQNGSLIPLLAEVLGTLERHVPLDPVQRAAEVDAAQREAQAFLASPDLGTLVALLDTIERAPSKALINRALVHLLTPQTSSPDDVFGGAARLAVHALQTRVQTGPLQQLAPFLARVIDPASPLVPGAITAFERLLTADQGNTVLNLLRAALNPGPGQSESPAAVLLHVTRAVSDAGAAAGGGAPALDAAGLADQLRGTVAFTRDDQRGLEFVFELIRNRQRTP